MALVTHPSVAMSDGGDASLARSGRLVIVLLEVVAQHQGPPLLAIIRKATMTKLSISSRKVLQSNQTVACGRVSL